MDQRHILLSGKQPVPEVINSKFTIDMTVNYRHKSVAERTRHQRQYERRVNKRQMQTQESKIDTGKALDADLVDTESIRTDSTVQDDSSKSGKCTLFLMMHDIRPIYDKKTMAETTEYSKQSLESENILLKETVAQFQKDFSRMEAHCIALELKYQNQSLKSGQHGQILNETSNKAKIEKEFDVLETMNIELEHSVATLPQIQEKVFAIAKFDKTSVLGKPVLPSIRNQSVVRQPNEFKSARAQMSKQRFESQVDVETNGRIFKAVGLRLDSYRKVYRALAQARFDRTHTIVQWTYPHIHGMQTNSVISYALSWKPCQGDSLNLPDHRIRRWCCSLIPAKSDS
ncbi:hypothetical protein Tco_1272614 [Tanacetum coccineum]